MEQLKPFLCRVLPDWLEPLMDLALDLRWTWNHGGDQLWEHIDSNAWQATRNPWWILQSLSDERIIQLSGDHQFREDLDKIISARQNYLNDDGWCRKYYRDVSFNPVAYFSMEFGLGEGLPLYAGGLGILAGDLLKTASDLNFPVIGIGLRYQEGYFRQLIDKEGRQVEAFPRNDPTNLPLRPLRDNAGGWLRVSVELPGRTLFLRVWLVQVGRVKLYLLDSNDPVNHPFDRSVLYKLYDDKPELRLMQEMALGIGGWRVIKALNLPVDVCHLNEGHTAFVIIERAKSYMKETGVSFEVALCATRAGNVFTTHTPVAAGFDRFPGELVASYFREYVSDMDISVDRILSLGCDGSASNGDTFIMSDLAMHGCIAVNGVSKLHGEVSRRIFAPMFPRWPEREIPVGSITNGVHMPSWDSKWSDSLWTETVGKGCWCGDIESRSSRFKDVPASVLWSLRSEGRKALVDYVRQYLSNQFRQYGYEGYDLEQIKGILNPATLTIGFARRFTSYKRPNLLISDIDRLTTMITNTEMPIQVVVAGKAHPRDEMGKQMVWQFVNLARKPGLRSGIVFLPDYDISVAQQLVQGVDLWLNTPQRPWEACGTSGMKVLVNGGINISELDGWWAEAYEPAFGWALGDGREHHETEWDKYDADCLYNLLEQKIIPMFYARDDNGIPVEWVAMIRESMAKLAPLYSSNRMLREYIDKMYTSAANIFHQRTALNSKLAMELHAWQEEIARNWPYLRFGRIDIRHEGSMWQYDVPVYLAGLNVDYVKVELYSDGNVEPGVLKHSLAQNGKLEGLPGWYMFSGVVPASKPAEHYTPRVVPFHPAARIPLEEHRILWYSTGQ